MSAVALPRRRYKPRKNKLVDALVTLRDIPVKEEDVQVAVIEALEAKGYKVLQTSRRGIYDKETGRTIYGPDGAEKGLSDLLVSRPEWNGFWICMEVKRPGKIKWSSEEQEQLYIDGYTSIVQSVDEAIADAEAAWERLKNGIK